MDVLTYVAELMALAARTAPKTRGEDFLQIKVISGEDVIRLGEAMRRYGEETGKKNFDRDGDNVSRSQAVLLLGLKGAKIAGLDCGLCGGQCKDMKLKPVPGKDFIGPICAWRIMDLGIALGSAAKMASILNADNRIMYRAGLVAKRIGLMDAEVVVAIPISAYGKNIYFDREH